MAYARLMNCVATIEVIGSELDYDVDFESISNGRKIIFKKYDKIYLKALVVDNTNTGGGIEVSCYDAYDELLFNEPSYFHDSPIKDKITEILKSNLPEIKKKEEAIYASIKGSIYEYKVEEVYSGELEKIINKMAKLGWDLYSSMVGKFKYDREYGDIKVQEYKLVFRKQK